MGTMLCQTIHCHFLGIYMCQEAALVIKLPVEKWVVSSVVIADDELFSREQFLQDIFKFVVLTAFSGTLVLSELIPGYQEQIVYCAILCIFLTVSLYLFSK